MKAQRKRKREGEQIDCLIYIYGEREKNRKKRREGGRER